YDVSQPNSIRSEAFKASRGVFVGNKRYRFQCYYSSFKNDNSTKSDKTWWYNNTSNRELMELNYFTGIGRRAVNEDVLCIERISSGCDLYMVIDGMGGHEKGDEAAKIVADRILTFLKHSKGPINETVLQKAVQ